VSEFPVRSGLIDGEAIVCDENGLAVFDLIRRHGALASAVLCAFDLLELNGLDLRRQPIELPKRAIAQRLELECRLNEHFDEDGEFVYREACKLGREGIASKRLGSPYRLFIMTLPTRKPRRMRAGVFNLALRNSSGGLGHVHRKRRASSLVSNFGADLRPGSPSQ
jgi:hypothetical protein